LWKSKVHYWKEWMPCVSILFLAVGGWFNSRLPLRSSLACLVRGCLKVISNPCNKNNVGYRCICGRCKKIRIKVKVYDTSRS
jgi:hypothetical protein